MDGSPLSALSVKDGFRVLIRVSTTISGRRQTRVSEGLQRRAL